MNLVFGLSVDQHIKSSQELRQVEQMPSDWVAHKVIDHIDDLSKRFIAASSLVVMSSSRPDGIHDVTPRGDSSGFIKVMNPKLLAIPDRPGNKRMDTFENVLGNPNLGLIFIIPGHRDTLRVSGKAALVKDAALGNELSINGRPSELVLLLQVEKVLCHCPKAFIRGKVWEQADWPDTSNVPSLAEMMKAHGELAHELNELEEGVKDDRETNLY